MTGMLTLDPTKPGDTYIFDPDAAERPIRFIERYIVHCSGPKVGEPFLLAPIQKQIIRDLFGWVWREIPTRRRFTDMYWEGAVGCGKSPVLAMLGIYGLVGDREAGAQIYSLASKYNQARIVFDDARNFIRASRPLDKILVTLDREIRYPAMRSFWRICSGKGPGAGAKPHMILADEVHDFDKSKAYDDLNDRKTKRSRPLLVAATNAGTSRASFCWKLREKAVAALKGEGDPALYPVIWAAEEEAKTDAPAAWRAANPMIGITMQESAIRAICREKMKNEVDEAEFRRLYLSIWPKNGAGRWLDLAVWDDCSMNFDAPAALAGLPLYVGLDLSQSDDLCSAVYCWLTPKKAYVDAHFWMPAATAAKYEESDSIPYAKWASEGAITLTDGPTISSGVRRDIASHVLARAKSYDLKAVCYDRYKADETIAVLESESVTCVPIPQGFAVSPGCNELDRRLKERAVLIAENPALRFCAENACLARGARGDVYPVKPDANIRTAYAGDRARKIDGISALVSLLVEARKHAFPGAVDAWKGIVCSLSPQRPAARTSSKA